ncbi:hypothetical protein IV203_006403 [Nitzschia inconspicua]|uniref:Uncharacterized protein n=1 Tax=Nitzschia inconspicua TaxID=303405 RepID=A0A9K3PAK2_9STRA|nr:hypothetical protein IV203_006403 [Nitzschia inconspicua]
MSELFDENGQLRYLQWTFDSGFWRYPKGCTKHRKSFFRRPAISSIKDLDIRLINDPTLYDESDGAELIATSSKIVETKNTWDHVRMTDFGRGRNRDHGRYRVMNPWVVPTLLCLLENAITEDTFSIRIENPEDACIFLRSSVVLVFVVVVV